MNSALKPAMVPAARKAKLLGATALCLLLLPVSLTGCSEPQTPASPSPTSTAQTTPTAPATPVRSPGATSKPSDAPLPGGELSESGAPAESQPDTSSWESGDTSAAPNAGNLLATDFRVGLHPSFYRVVVEFEGSGTPGWFAGWVDQARELGRGEPLPLKPGKHLDVRIEGTRMPILKGDPDKFYSGPADKWIDEDVVAWFDTAFEGQTHFAVSVPDARGYRIFTLQDPVRLVIDIAR